MRRGKKITDRERSLLDISLALSQEQDKRALLTRIVEGAQRLTRAEGGTLYSVREGFLHFEIVRNDKFPIGVVQLAPIALESKDRVIAVAACQRRTLCIRNVYEEAQFSTVFDRETGYKTKALLVVPISHQDEVIAVLQLINPADPDFFTDEDIELAESLASLAGAALAHKQLVDDLRTLLYSLTRVISEAMADPGHEKRVPILAYRLAEAVSREERGPLAPVCFTAAEMEELRLAAYLHDCGKIGIPQHLLQKKTKLEAVVDRIECIKERVHDPDDLLFLERCNRGEVYDRQRIERINGLTSGEREALLVEDGTLTEAERRIVETHVERTYKMLSQLKYPKDLARVPEIAASHHERIDGKGYPRGLKGNQIPIRGRILAIADVFEAL